MRPRILSIALFAGLCAACGVTEPNTPTSTSDSANILPLRRLRLYETGVGYFERAGKVHGKSGVLPVPAGHLDDALKSLVVFAPGGNDAVKGLAFASSVTKASARARAGLPPDPDHPLAFADLLASMKGESVVVVTRNGAFKDGVTGRVIDVLSEGDDDKKGPKQLAVMLLGERGDVVRIDASEILRIRPKDEAYYARLGAALDALSTRNAQNARALSLLGPSGDAAFGYIAETPIWRASYRLILGARPGEPTELQGWALLHNDTDERWQNVRLELVNGEPDSFVFPLAAPRYARRELVHPDAPLSTLPQLHHTTADALWGDNVDSIGVGSIGLTGYGEGGGGSGEGYGYGHGSHSVKSPTVTAGPSALLSVGNLAQVASATGTDNGALFVYSIPSAFQLDAHSSALVPFLSKPLETELVAWFSDVGSHARSAVRFVNDTGQTLPAGTLAVFGGGGFSGETSLDRLKPGQRRFLQVGNELDVEVRRQKRTVREETKRITFHDDTLDEHFLRTIDESWEIESRATLPRSLFVSYASSQNAKITGADRLDYDEASSKPVIVFRAKPKEKATRSFTVVEGLSYSTRIDDLDEKRVRTLLQKASLPAAEVALLKDALEPVRALEGERRRIADADRDSKAANEELTRLREDLKALGGDKGGNAGTAAAPIVKRVIEAETHLLDLQKRRNELQRSLLERRDAAAAALRRIAAE